MGTLRATLSGEPKCVARFWCGCRYHEARRRAQGYASSAVQAAIRRGDLADLRPRFVPCVDCGARAVQYDHRDYNEPMKVEPVCDSCGKRRGPASFVLA